RNHNLSATLKIASTIKSVGESKTCKQNHTLTKMSPTSSPLIFKVNRCEPELVRPARPTPHETKLLSDIDDQEVLRYHFPMIQFYQNNPTIHGKDPAAVIRRAVAETLVYYYPLAGRLREVRPKGRKLVVDCTGEGVLFIEADVDVRLSEFGEIRPPFACVEELLFDVPGSSAVVDSPLLLIQVTRLQCGGFIVAFRIQHCMSDAAGLIQFMSAVAEIARGATTAPTVTPVWERHILTARSPPRVTCTHEEYKRLPTTYDPKADMMTSASFLFGPTEITALRHCVHTPTRASRFEILAACLWKCRTAALEPDDPNQEMRMILPVNSRGRLVNPPLPKGYYGNAQALPVAVAPAHELCQKPLAYALDLVRKAKSKVKDEYMKSVADLMVIEGARRPDVMMTKWTCILSDVTHAGFEKVDFGWGEAVYGGPIGPDPARVTNFCMLAGSNKEGIVLISSLPVVAMERFVKELESMLHGPLVDKKFSYILAAL
ncbi:Benzyl alcohol O-benzoyltransferase, partial [Linum grandiflorum]